MSQIQLSSNDASLQASIPKRSEQILHLTHRSVSVPEVPVAGVSIGVPVVVGNGHIVQTVMLRWRWGGVRQAIWLVG